VKSDHSSHQSGIGDGGVLDRSVESVRAPFTPSDAIQEEPREIADDTNTRSPSQQQTDEPIVERLIRRQTLGELGFDTFTSDVHPHLTQDEERPHPRGQSGSRSTMTTEFSRQFEFVDAVDTGADDSVQEYRNLSLQEETKRKHLESRADHVLVATLPASDGQQPQEPQDDMEQLQQGAAALMGDALNVAIQHVSRAEPAPLTPAAIRAAQVITLDILNRAMRHLELTCSGTKCGPGHIKLASTIVRRVLDSATRRDVKWSTKALEATSLLVEDVLSSARRGVNAAIPDHAWSREALQVSCMIIRDVMTDAASTSTTKQATPPRQQQTIDVKRFTFLFLSNKILILIKIFGKQFRLRVSLMFEQNNG